MFENRKLMKHMQKKNTILEGMQIFKHKKFQCHQKLQIFKTHA